MKIFRHLLLTAFLLIFINVSNAQTYDTTQYYGKMNYVFQHINKSQVPTGILKDYGIEFLNLNNYKGTALHDSNYVGLNEWRMLYTSMYSAQINGNNLLYLDTLNRLINSYNYTSMPVTFASLHYNYQQLRDDAITANLMYESNEQLYDVPGRQQSPYVNEELFAIAPIRQAIFTGSTNLMFRPELFFSNTGKAISSIQIDPANSGNYQTVSFNVPVTVTYSTKGFYTVNIKISYSDGTIRYGHTKFAVYDNPSGQQARYGTRPATNEQVTATKAYLGGFAQGDITIDLARNNTTGQIRKPLIIVEGFDPTGDFTYNDRGGFIDRINDDINNGNAITLNQGLDDINEYDLIFLNYASGTDYIQRNAFLLERVIEIVNQRKTLWNGVRQQNVIIGMSMGGLVTRYALRDMEILGQNHETRLFISHDAPQWGANVPVGAQAAVQHLAPWQIVNIGGNFPFIRWVDMFPQIVDAQNLFNSPAAKQMLIQRYIVNGQNLTADNTEHNNFLNEINNMGWPLNCRNLTLANGNCDGTPVFPDNSTIFTMDGGKSMTYFGSLWRSLLISFGSVTTLPSLATLENPSFNRWAMLWQFPLSLLSTRSSIDLDFKIRAIPRTGTQEIYRGDIVSNKKVLGFINVKNYFIKCHVNSSTAMLALDNAPGGVYDLNEFGFNANILTQQLPAFFAGVQASVLQPRFSFVPTVSSLALINPQQYLFSNICNTVNCLNSPQVHDFFAPNQRELHISYTQASTNWILQRQDANFNCIKICPPSLSILGDDILCTTSSNNYAINNLPAGAQVQWQATPQGIVNINSPNSAQTSLTKVSNGRITLSASISGTCALSPINIEKQNITVGPPGAIGILQYNSLELCDGNAYFKVLTPNPPGFYQYSGTLAVSSYTGEPIIWSLAPYSSSTNWAWSVNNNTLSVATKHNPASIVLRATAKNGCGNTFKDYHFNTGICMPPVEAMSAPEEDMTLAVNPNPVASSFTATLNETTDPTASIKKIVIKNKTGFEVKQLKFDGNSKTQNVNIQNLPADVYVVQVFDGKKWRSRKIIKQ